MFLAVFEFFKQMMHNVCLNLNPLFQGHRQYATGRHFSSANYALIQGRK
jgi:hypothetical protein